MFLNFLTAKRGNPNFDAPPAYQAPPGSWQNAPPPAYSAPNGGYYGWVPPTDVFPNAPPANTVFMSDMPPPYPGINSAGFAGYAMSGHGMMHYFTTLTNAITD